MFSSYYVVNLEGFALYFFAGRNFKHGMLGPSTIVGSAAFNLLVVTAVCISTATASESRRISEILVFIVTSISSVLAYIWLLLILKVLSPNVIEIWEALMTLLFFVVLVGTVYVADKKFCLKMLKKRKAVNIIAPEEYINGESKTYPKALLEKPEQSDDGTKVQVL